MLLAPSWRALQRLITVLNVHAESLDLTCNILKTVAMVFDPKNTNKIVSKNFPLFKIGSSSIQYITQFKYLGHVISNSVNDDEDIQREIRNMFIRTNILVRRFSMCSLSVKTVLFKSYCICMYDVALWRFFKKGTMDRFHSCYNKMCKGLFWL